MSDDGFIEVYPAGNKPDKVPCTIACAKLRSSQRVTLTFRLDLVDEDIAHILRAGPRFNVAYNPATRTLRLAAKPDGRYETNALPKTDGLMVAMRFPLPEKMPFVGDRVRFDPDPNRQQAAIFIDLPPAYIGSEAPTKKADAPMPKPAPAPAPSPAPETSRRPFVPPMPPQLRDVAPALMGDPSPERSALAGRKP